MVPMVPAVPAAKCCERERERDLEWPSPRGFPMPFALGKIAIDRAAVWYEEWLGDGG